MPGRSARLTSEQCVCKFVGAERLQVLDFLAHANEVHRNRPLPRDCRENAALCRAIELGHDQTRQAQRIVERLHRASAFWPVFASMTSNTSCGASGCAFAITRFTLRSSSIK